MSSVCPSCGTILQQLPVTHKYDFYCAQCDAWVSYHQLKMVNLANQMLRMAAQMTLKATKENSPAVLSKEE